MKLVHAEDERVPSTPSSLPPAIRRLLERFWEADELVCPTRDWRPEERGRGSRCAARMPATAEGAGSGTLLFAHLLAARAVVSADVGRPHAGRPAG
jgi:hypothetical protein